jgi:hypothetical protein
MLVDPDFRPSTSSLLGRQHFQIAYVTSDLERATDVLGASYGIGQFGYVRDVPLPAGGKIDVALAWAGTVNLEIIQGSGNPESFYERHLPVEGFATVFHHLGYLVPDETEWAQIRATVDASGKEIVHSGTVDGLDFLYVRAPELGHYLEYVRPSPAWSDFLQSLPRF